MVYLQVYGLIRETSNPPALRKVVCSVLLVLRRRCHRLIVCHFPVCCQVVIMTHEMNPDPRFSRILTSILLASPRYLGIRQMAFSRLGLISLSLSQLTSTQLNFFVTYLQLNS